jgi:hypothetical protein
MTFYILALKTAVVAAAQFLTEKTHLCTDMDQKFDGQRWEPCGGAGVYGASLGAFELGYPFPPMGRVHVDELRPDPGRKAAITLGPRSASLSLRPFGPTGAAPESHRARRQYCSMQI